MCRCDLWQGRCFVITRGSRVPSAMYGLRFPSTAHQLNAATQQRTSAGQVGTNGPCIARGCLKGQRKSAKRQERLPARKHGAASEVVNRRLRLRRERQRACGYTRRRGAASPHQPRWQKVFELCATKPLLPARQACIAMRDFASVRTLSDEHQRDFPNLLRCVPLQKERKDQHGMLCLQACNAA